MLVLGIGFILLLIIFVGAICFNLGFVEGYQFNQKENE
jgi:hypothetical protein